MHQVAGWMKGDLELGSYCSEGILEKWSSKQLPPPQQTPLTKPIP